MKRILAIILLACMLLSCLVACDTAPAKDTDEPRDTENKDTNATDESDTTNATDPADTTPVPEGEVVYAGYGRECITPEGSVSLAGYPDIRMSKSVESDLYVSCTAIRDKDGDTILLYSLDLQDMRQNQAKNLREAIEKETGVPSANIVLNITHTHAAPFISYVIDSVEIALVSAAKTAIDDLSLATIYTGTKDVSGLTYVRRYVDANGDIVSGDSPKAVAHEVEPDATMPMIMFEREGKKDIVLANFAAHVDTVGSRNRYTVSSDFVGVARDFIEGKRDAYLSIHMGAAGNLSPFGFLRGEIPYNTHTKEYGQKLAKAIDEGISELTELQNVKSEIKIASDRIRLEVDHSMDEYIDYANAAFVAYREGDTKTMNESMAKIPGLKGGVSECIGICTRILRGHYERLELTAISLGNIAFAVAPYEMFTETGKDIKDGSEFDLTFMCAYSNGQECYIATEAAFAAGGYEVYSGVFVPGTAEIISATLIELLGQVK